MISGLLFYPFEKYLLPSISDGSVCAAIECEYDEAFKKISNLKVFNSFKPQAAKWERYEIAPLQADYYDYIFLQVPKQKIAVQAFIAKAFGALKQDGSLICVAANDAGGKTLEKTVQAFGVATQSLSKSKCRIVVTQKNKLNSNEVARAINEGMRQKMTFGNEVYVTQPGIFGWNKIDRGSKLLIETLGDYLKGTGADFGCGYGYLSDQILKNNKTIKKLHAIDADYNALECAKENLKEFDVEYHWEDLTCFKLSNLDWIIMNPPFHEGKKTDSDIGKKFIENAAKSLKKNGILYMVANAYLPYEKMIDTYFSHKEKVKEQDGFKIFKAIK